MAEANRQKPVKLGSSIATLLSPNGVDWAGKCHVVGIHLCNVDNTDRDVWLSVQRSGVEYQLLSQKTIPANDSILVTTHLVLEPGDLLRGYGSSANAIHAVISGIEGVA